MNTASLLNRLTDSVTYTICARATAIMNSLHRILFVCFTSHRSTPTAAFELIATVLRDTSNFFERITTASYYGGMEKYLDLKRRFGHLVSYSTDELLATDVRGKRLTWAQILEGRFSIIVGRANFGKTFEFGAQCRALRADGRVSMYVALHRILGEDDIEDALEPEERDVLANWKKSGGEIIVFVDSLDEVSLGTESGIRKALRRVSKALDWPNSDVKWVLSSRPAVLTEEVLEQLLAELRTTLYRLADETLVKDELGIGFTEANSVSQDNEDDPEAQKAESPDEVISAINTVESSNSASMSKNKVPQHEQLKVFALLPLDKTAAALYLSEHLSIIQPKLTLNAARQYGLERLAEGPGGLDILGYIDPARNPPQCLTQVFEKMTEAMQQQQRTDPREQRVGNPPPENLERAIERLASASVVCGLTNIELSPKALRYRDGVLSARPIIASLLSESSLEYLLGSRLFTDSGQYQVKLYPDDLLPFLAAKRLAGLVSSPEQAHRLLANFTWHSTTGECGVYRALLSLAGWLSVFSTHCRQELLRIEPQAVAFFGDLRNPQIPLEDAAIALECAIERLVNAGDSIGRRHFTLTAENFWQATKPGIEPTLVHLFTKFGADLNARDVLLDIAGHARLDVFRDTLLDEHGWDYTKLLDERLDLGYILALGRHDDFQALGAALQKKPELSEPRAALIIGELAWKSLDAKSIAMLVAEQFRRGRGGFSIDWVLTGSVAEESSNLDLYRLTRSLLLRLVNSKVKPGRNSERFWSDQKFVELVIDLLAMLINRSMVAASTAAKLCLVLNRFTTKYSHGNADTAKLHVALKSNKAVRLAFLRGLIQPTDKTPDGIFRGVFLYHSLYPRVDGDELELKEAGFTELLEAWTRDSAKPQRKPAKRHARSFVVDAKSKETLGGMLTELRDATEDSAFAWVAQWLNNTIQQTHYSECNFMLFEQAVGSEIALAVREGLSTLWRRKEPTWSDDEPNSTYNITIAGLQGLFLDLGDGSALPALSELEVRRSIRYAQFEINGYPKWFWNLVRVYEQIATSELSLILTNASNGPVSREKAETLIQHLDDAPIGVQQNLARAAWNFVLETPSVTEYTSSVALRIATTNQDVIDQSTFEAEASTLMESTFKEQIPSLNDPADTMDAEGRRSQKLVNQLTRQRANAVIWGSLWLCTYPDSFSQHWGAWRTSNSRAAEDFMFSLAAELGRDHGARLRQVADKGSAGLNTLKMLYDWTHSLVKEEDDRKHEDGRVYSPNERDHAQQFREALVPAISHAKSEQAYEVLEELRIRAAAPAAKYLRYVQFMMREEQFAQKPIVQTDYPEFERNLAPPVSGYTTFAMAVENDLLNVKNQIETGDFSLRRFFNSVSFDRIKTDNAGLALEEDFQSLLGSELNHAASGRYVVALEPILPGGTRRDVLCQVGALRATVELKMSTRWSLSDYIEALEHQLQGQYMTGENSKIGFFVIVLQKEREWKTLDGNRIGFDDLLTILRTKAREKEVADSSLFLRVIGIDATPKVDFRLVRDAGTKSQGTGSPKYVDGAGNSWVGRGQRPKWVKDALASGKKLDDLLAAKS